MQSPNHSITTLAFVVLHKLHPFRMEDFHSHLLIEKPAVVTLKKIASVIAI